MSHAATSARRSSATRTRACSPAARCSSTTSSCPACCTPRSCAARTRTRASLASTPPRRARGAGVVAVYTADGSRRLLAPRAAPRAAAAGRRRGLQRAHPGPAREGQGAPRRRAGRDGVAASRYVAEDAAADVVVEWDPLPVVADLEAALRAGRAARPRRPARQRRRARRADARATTPRAAKRAHRIVQRRFATTTAARSRWRTAASSRSGTRAPSS